MRFLQRSELLPWFEGKRVAIVGSGPGVLANPPGMVDAHDVVVRVNNYKLSPAAGSRCDVFYSFFGTSIRKTREELIRDGVKLCMAKLPAADVSERGPGNPNPPDAGWHRANGKMIGLDFRPHYQRRERMGFWFCDTYVPTVADFMASFELLGRHMPTTGFAAILDVLSFKPAGVYLTGFDFFASRVHNVDEPWSEKNLDDPYRHRPDIEREQLYANLAFDHPIYVDVALRAALLTTRSDAA